MYVRQYGLLALLDALGGGACNLDFQKLLFLYCQELSSPDQASTAASLYEFVPYRYGAFSFMCYTDRRYLVDNGLLVDNENRWVLTKEGRHFAHEARDASIRAFVRRYRGLRGDALIAETYRRYPYYAIRSEIAKQVLQDDKVALRRIESVRPRPKGTSSRLMTIGYEGRTLESYLNALLQAGVTLLCDVRRNAISRKYGFSKTTLAKACSGVGMRYEHLPELGIESRLRQGLKTPEDFNALFKAYERRILPRQVDALAKIRTWLRFGEAVALTCYEREAGQCHRHCVAAALGQVSDQGDRPGRPARTRPVKQGYTVTHL